MKRKCPAEEWATQHARDIQQERIAIRDFATVLAVVLELLTIAKAYRNLLRTSAHTEGEVATFHHIGEIIAKAEGTVGP